MIRPWSRELLEEIAGYLAQQHPATIWLPDRPGVAVEHEGEAAASAGPLAEPEGASIAGAPRGAPPSTAGSAPNDHRELVV